jgi:hypothetical protein
VPADASSPIPSGLDPLCDANPLQEAEPLHLLAYLATIPDPRAPRGRRHPLIAILAMAAAAVLGGARSMTAIAEWAADAPQPVRAALGARRDSPDHCSVPSETTIRRTLGRLDADALATAIGAWLANRDDQRRHRRAVAVDGKTLRGATDTHGQARRRALTPSEAGQLLARFPLFWWDHVLALLGTGLRFGELAGLRRRLHLDRTPPVLQVVDIRYQAGRFGSGFKPRPKATPASASSRSPLRSSRPSVDSSQPAPTPATWSSLAPAAA